MSKTFTCRELGGVCDETFSGNTLEEIMHKAMPHMQSDDAHKAHIANLADTTGESKDQWFARIQREFAARPDDDLP